MGLFLFFIYAWLCIVWVRCMCVTACEGRKGNGVGRRNDILLLKLIIGVLNVFFFCSVLPLCIIQSLLFIFIDSVFFITVIFAFSYI